MFYRPEDGHGLPHNPFNAIVTPRPIGWISTRSGEGVNNLAPYSFFNAVCAAPPMIMFSSDGFKHSATNAIETGAFVHNIVSLTLADRMNLTSQSVDENIDEFSHAGLDWVAGDVVDAVRVRDALASMECVVTGHQILKDRHGQDTQSVMVIGEVVRVHIQTSILRDGMVDELALDMISRLGYRSYGHTREIFEMVRPQART